MDYKKIALYLAWLVAWVAMVGSLYLSEVMKFPPCALCWYQRIAMYPLTAILAVGIIKKDKLVPFYVSPLSIIGLVISGYHNLLYYNILPESHAPCSLGISCTTRYLEVWGFITIPLMSFVAFLIITALMVVNLKKR